MADNQSPKGSLPHRERSASFHGITSTAAANRKQWQLRRPKTQQDLLARSTGMSLVERSMVPAKVVVNVTVQRSLGPLQVMASTQWTVEELVAVAVKQYRKEERRPLLHTEEPRAFTLHYSQFSLESLDPKEKLIGLGSRNFFLCPHSTIMHQ